MWVNQIDLKQNIVEIRKTMIYLKKKSTKKVQTHKNFIANKNI